MANLILLVFLLLVLGAFAGGGWWAFNKFVRKKTSKPIAVVVTPPPRPSTTPVKPPGPGTTTTTTTSAPQPATPQGTASTSPAGVFEQPSVTTPPTTPAATTTIPPLATVPDPAPAPTPGLTPPTTPPTTPTPTPTVAATTPATPATPEDIPPAPPPDSPPGASTTPGDNPNDSLPPDVVADVPAQKDEPITVFEGESPEVKALKEDADRRIEEAPSDLYPEREKTRVRMALRNSRRLARVATLHFATGATRIGAGEQARLKKALQSPEASDLMADPDVAVVCIGFADQTGDPQRNKEISKQRAMTVIDTLKKQGVRSTTYPVAIGGTEVISAGNKDKNRAVEIWFVLQ
jgi:outer membrane protein OmpA-like peptidoglycan-associated protein